MRRRDSDALRCLCGVAPVVTRRSGKRLVVTHRLAAHDRPLGACGRPTRFHQQRQVSGAPRLRPRTRLALGGRPPAQRCLRDAPGRRPFRPATCPSRHGVSRRDCMRSRSTSPLGESDACDGQWSLWVRLRVHGNGSVHGPSRHVTFTSTEVATIRNGACKIVGSPPVPGGHQPRRGVADHTPVGRRWVGRSRQELSLLYGRKGCCASRRGFGRWQKPDGRDPFSVLDRRFCSVAGTRDALEFDDDYGAIG